MRDDRSEWELEIRFVGRDGGKEVGSRPRNGFQTPFFFFKVEDEAAEKSLPVFPATFENKSSKQIHCTLVVAFVQAALRKT